jgi:hypothetical protein
LRNIDARLNLMPDVPAEAAVACGRWPKIVYPCPFFRVGRDAFETALKGEELTSSYEIGTALGWMDSVTSLNISASGVGAGHQSPASSSAVRRALIARLRRVLASSRPVSRRLRSGSARACGRTVRQASRNGSPRRPPGSVAGWRSSRAQPIVRSRHRIPASAGPRSPVRAIVVLAHHLEAESTQARICSGHRSPDARYPPLQPTGRSAAFLNPPPAGCRTPIWRRPPAQQGADTGFEMWAAAGTPEGPCRGGKRSVSRYLRRRASSTSPPIARY